MRETIKLTDAIHVELLASAFALIVPSLVMSALFTLTGAVAIAQTDDAVLRILYAAGMAATVVRIAVTLHYRPVFARRPIAAPAVVRIERRFAAAFLAFALLFGLFAARVAMVAPPRIAVLATVLSVGYAAGVSTGVALRPFISVPSMVLGVAPTILTSGSDGPLESRTLAIVLVGLLAGGIRSTLARYRAAVDDIGMRQMFAMLARSDPLTGLPNRLALTERLAELAQGRAAATLFCIDLDDFKPVNDHHGHAVGDAVLVEAAARLRALTRPGDLVTRVGGDEFVLVRSEAEEDPDAFAMTVMLRLSEPYRTGGRLVSIGASVGTAPLLPEEPAEQALARADGALYRAKRFRDTSDVAETRRAPDARLARRRYYRRGMVR